MNETKIDMVAGDKPTTIMDAARAVEQNNNGTNNNNGAEKKPTTYEAVKNINHSFEREKNDAFTIWENVNQSVDNAKKSNLSNVDLTENEEELKTISEELQNLNNTDVEQKNDEVTNDIFDKYNTTTEANPAQETPSEVVSTDNPDYSKVQGDDAWGGFDNEITEEVKAEGASGNNPDYSKVQGEDAWGGFDNEVTEEVKKDNEPNLSNVGDAVGEGDDADPEIDKEVVSAIGENDTTKETGEVTEALFDLYNPPSSEIDSKVTSLGEETKEPENVKDEEQNTQETITTEKVGNEIEEEKEPIKEESNENKQEIEKPSELEQKVEALTKLIEISNERMQKLEASMTDIEDRLNKLTEKMESMGNTPPPETEKPLQQAETNNPEQKPSPSEQAQNIELDGLSEEAADWKIKEAALKNNLYAANSAWIKKNNPTNYDAYIKAYNKLARHNTNAWHNDGLMGEEVYKPYNTTEPRPEVESVNRPFLSGNVMFNEISPDKIKPQEVTDIAKTLMWERQKNPAVVDFQFAKDYRVNLWQMRNETRELIEKKIVELGGNNYEMLKPTQPAENAAPSTEKGAETATTLPHIPESYKEAYEELIKTNEEFKKAKKEIEKQKNAYNLTLDIVSNLYGGKNGNEYVLGDLEKYGMSEDDATEFFAKLKGTGFNTGQKDTGKYYVRRRF